MLFNSLEFAAFLPVVFLIYWFLTARSLKIQNLFILIASYFFYGWWDWRFLGLIFFSSLVDYTIGLNLYKRGSARKRKILLTTSLLVNLGLLGYFKYYNFFVESFVDAFSFMGRDFSAQSLSIVLPVGISFYTFQTLSYTIDIYRRKIKPTKDIIAFFAFVSFFPQLVAGPIERAKNLLPQFIKPRKFDYELAKDGLRQILWGLVKKIVIADTCAVYANEIFENYQDYSGIVLFMGAVYFAFQIYGDFSGYSDIAIGTAKLFGFDIMRNFANPYFSRDIAEFWRRWHISLSTWFRDYLYIPLGGSKGNLTRTIFNIFAIFIVSGFWHGANWTFIVWGALNASYYIPLLLTGSTRKNLDTVAQNRLLPNFKETLQILSTFLLTTLAWVFFRAETVTHALSYLSRLFTHLFELDFVQYEFLPVLSIFIIWEWIMRREKHGLEIGNLKLSVRWSMYYALLAAIIFYYGEEQEFIYFQF